MNNVNYIEPFLAGVMLTISLVIAFGPQNTFLLRQGLSNTHMRTAVGATIACEFLLVALGVAGVGTLVQNVPFLRLAFTYTGAAFLLYYGGTSAWRAITSKYDDIESQAPFPTARAVLLAALSFSLLNPASLFDTVVLIGGLAGQFTALERVAYAAGSLIMSSLWFMALICAAKQLAPLFAKPIAWRLFDGLIALIMFALALRLLLHAD